MQSSLASALLVIAIVATILPSGYPAYIGAYVALVAAILALLVFGWRERAVFTHPTSLAILAAILLVGGVLPFVYRSPQDFLAPVLILPMLTTIALGLLARPARWVPSPTVFALTCLFGSLIALVGGAYEHFMLGIDWPGLGNNPIHYGTLAVFSGSLAIVGVVSGKSPYRSSAPPRPCRRKTAQNHPAASRWTGQKRARPGGHIVPTRLERSWPCR